MNITGPEATIIACVVAAFVTFYIRHKNAVAAAAVLFRATIDPEFIGDLHGHPLESALLGATAGSLAGGFKVEGLYWKHRRAVNEFRHYLGPIDRCRLDRAWKAYHGGNEDYPNLFVMYCLPPNGPELLKHRLESLRKIGSHT